MKTTNFVLGTLMVALPLTGFAVDTISGPVNDDLFFPRGVLIEGVEGPDDTESTSGTSSVQIEGAGTVTVADQRIGDFPRVLVSGGTKISSTRKWSSEDLRKTWWAGQFSAPSKGISPKYDEVDFASGTKKGDKFQIKKAYQWGLSNETFKFSPAAGVVLPADEIDGVKLLLAYKSSSGSWSVKRDDYCVVQSGLCPLEVSDIRAVAIIKESYLGECPMDSITNGNTGSVPDCAVSCNRGYELSSDGTACLNPDGEEEFFDEEPFEESVEDFSEEEVVEEKAPSMRSGYVRYRGSRGQERVLDEEGLTNGELNLVRKMNLGVKSPIPNSEVLASLPEEEDGEDSMRDQFINYILEMRNNFGEGESGNVYTTASLQQEEAPETVEAVAAEMEEEVLHGAAPLLPSTGPEIFAVLAIAGITLMLIGTARRKE